MKKGNIELNINGIKFGIFIFSFMWLFFIIENIFPSLKYMVGIEPRKFEFGNIFSLFLSWASHDNFKHLLNHSISLFILLLFICVLTKKVMSKIFLMIILT